MQEYSKDIPEGVTNIKIDIGLGMMNVNSLDWLEKNTNLCLLCFEPNLESRNSCINHMNSMNNIIKNNNNTVIILPYALSNIAEPTKLNFYSMLHDGGTSSLYKPIDARLGPIKYETVVDTYSLKHFFDLFPWDRFEYIDYIKIDAQGADFDILKSAGDYLKDKVVFITAEPESEYYDGCQDNTTKNMIEYLKTQNFEQINHPNTQDPTFLNNKFKHLYNKIYIKQI
uniref:Methyltransferase FkbM domain-containing protein n=1 Tax=viral metagenome TaxID=1070528 RepID=A0A6C0B0H3_9ZZZZ